MKFGNVTLSAGMLLAIGLAGWLLATCARRDGIAIGRQLAHDDATDRINAARAAAEIEATTTFRHQLDSLARANTASRALPAQRARSDSAGAAIAAIPDSLIPKRRVEDLRHEKDSTIALLDSIVAHDSVGIRARDVRILALESSVRSYADTIVPNLTRDRNKWRQRALANCGLQLTAGYGPRGVDAVAGYGCKIPLRLPLLGGF